jgi:hypothetical protein
MSADAPPAGVVVAAVRKIGFGCEAGSEGAETSGDETETVTGRVTREGRTRTGARPRAGFRDSEDGVRERGGTEAGDASDEAGKGACPGTSRRTGAGGARRVDGAGKGDGAATTGDAGEGDGAAATDGADEADGARDETNWGWASPIDWPSANAPTRSSRPATNEGMSRTHSEVQNGSSAARAVRCSALTSASAFGSKAIGLPIAARSR